MAKYRGADVIDETKSIGSFGFGAFIDWLFCEDYPEFGIGSGLFYKQYGGKQEGTGDGYDYTSTDRLSYLIVPFNLNYELFDNFRVEAGPDVSFLLGAKQIQKYNGDKTTQSGTDYFHKAEFGINAGVIYTHPETGIGAYFRYNTQLGQIYKDRDSKVYNRAFSVGLQYPINRLFYHND